MKCVDEMRDLFFRQSIRVKNEDILTLPMKYIFIGKVSISEIATEVYLSFAFIPVKVNAGVFPIIHFPFLF